MKKNPKKFFRTEKPCRRAESAYYRANGARDPRLIILFRFCLLVGSERIDILSTASEAGGPHFRRGPVRPPGPTTASPYKGGVYILSNTLGIT